MRPRPHHHHGPSRIASCNRRSVRTECLVPRYSVGQGRHRLTCTSAWRQTPAQGCCTPAGPWHSTAAAMFPQSARRSTHPALMPSSDPRLRQLGLSQPVDPALSRPELVPEELLHSTPGECCPYFLQGQVVSLLSMRLHSRQKQGAGRCTCGAGQGLLLWWAPGQPARGVQEGQWPHESRGCRRVCRSVFLDYKLPGHPGPSGLPFLHLGDDNALNSKLQGTVAVVASLWQNLTLACKLLSSQRLRVGIITTRLVTKNRRACEQPHDLCQQPVCKDME